METPRILCNVNINLCQGIDVHDQLFEVKPDMTLGEFRTYLFKNYIAEHYIDEKPDMDILFNGVQIAYATNFATLFNSTNRRPLEITIQYQDKPETISLWRWIVGGLFGT